MGAVSLTIDDETHRRARAEAALAGIWFQDFVEQAIAEKAKRDRATREARERRQRAAS